MRLIDADALEGEAICLYTYGGARYIPLDALKRAPTVDAVEVVRCRDCKRWEPYENFMNRRTDGTCLRKYNDAERPATDGNHYCAYGEQK